MVNVEAKIVTVRVKGLQRMELCIDAYIRDLDVAIREGREYAADPTASVKLA